MALEMNFTIKIDKQTNNNKSVYDSHTDMRLCYLQFFILQVCRQIRQYFVMVVIIDM